ncbi:MAG: hypothetical protein IJF11_04300 [Clostridia bacterium]|nr:hypothetical protein [Clostridia bacterium]
MQDLKITFKIEKLPLYAVSQKNGQRALEIQASEGALNVSIWYDYEQRPLILTSCIGEGDMVELILLDYRIELYINGKLMDEDWPAGNRLFCLSDELDLDIQVTEHHHTESELPSVISSFECAEGWYPGDGVFVGDCMPYRRNDEYHVLYLKDRHHHKSKWGMGAHQWEHISTKDFKTWQVHPMAVPITDKEEGSICTGSWIKNGDTEYLYYTIRRGNGQSALISRSVSSDGYHFIKDKSFCFVISDKYDKASTRDPKVFYGEDGLFHMLLTTSLSANNQGCLAHYVSRDLEEWSECDEPFYIVPNGDQPECPDYFKYNGKYYLVYSLRGRGYYMISDKPFDGFALPQDPIIPCAGVPKCAFWNGELVFTGFKVINGYAGSMTFSRAHADNNGILVFEQM